MRTHLVYTPENRELSEEELRNLAPAAFGEVAAPRLSERYALVNTAAAIPIMRECGLVPVGAKQVKPHARNADQIGFKEHFLAFAEVHALAVPERPQVIVYNSHDGTSAVKLFAGVYRSICSNTMIRGNGFEGRAYHRVADVEGFLRMVRDAIAGAQDYQALAEQFKGVQVPRDLAEYIAEKALALRWKRQLDRKADECGLFFRKEHIEQALVPLRADDAGEDAWTLYNKLQEVLIRGKLELVSYSKKNPAGKARHARPIGSISESVLVNRRLGDIVEAEFC